MVQKVDEREVLHAIAEATGRQTEAAGKVRDLGFMANLAMGKVEAIERNLESLHGVLTQLRDQLNNIRELEAKLAGTTQDGDKKPSEPAVPYSEVAHAG